MKVGVIWKGVGDLARQLVGVSPTTEHLPALLNYLKAVNHVFRYTGSLTSVYCYYRGSTSIYDQGLTRSLINFYTKNCAHAKNLYSK